MLQVLHIVPGAAGRRVAGCCGAAAVCPVRVLVYMRLLLLNLRAICCGDIYGDMCGGYMIRSICNIYKK